MKKIVQAKARFQLRGDTETALSAQNPVFKAKEPVLILDENGQAIAFKVGDGKSAYTQLPLHLFSEKGDKGDPGEDYVLTADDKAEIAQAVLAILPHGDEVAY